MSYIKLFKTDEKQVQVIEGHSVAIEKSLQSLIESHLEIFLGIRLVKSVYPTGIAHAAN